MKMIKTLGLTLAAAGLMTITAQAIPIVGSIGFTGTYAQNGGTIGNLATAVDMSIATVNVGSTSGDFVGAGGPLWFATPIGVNGNGPAVATLWSVTVGAQTYTFSVSSMTQTFTSGSQLNLAGTGTMSDGVGPKDDTAGTFQLGFGNSGTAFEWQSTSSANVPDGGASLILLGMGLMGLVAVRRNRA